MFPKKYQRIAEKIAMGAATLWMNDKLTPRRIKKVIVEACGDTPVTIDYGSYRTVAILPNGVIKVPHDPRAIRSTFSEARLFRIMSATQMKKHFPFTELVSTEGIPVLVQERIDDVMLMDEPWVGKEVERFANRIGLGDVHNANYGWRKDKKGMYPVFIDCETNQNMRDLTEQEINKVRQSKVRWPYSV